MASKSKPNMKQALNNWLDKTNKDTKQWVPVCELISSDDAIRSLCLKLAEDYETKKIPELEFMASLSTVSGKSLDELEKILLDVTGADELDFSKGNEINIPIKHVEQSRLHGTTLIGYRINPPEETIAWKNLEYEYHEMPYLDPTDKLAEFLHMDTHKWESLLAEFRRRYNDNNGIWITRSVKDAISRYGKYYGKTAPIYSVEYNPNDIVIDYGDAGIFVMNPGPMKFLSQVSQVPDRQKQPAIQHDDHAHYDVDKDIIYLPDDDGNNWIRLLHETGHRELGHKDPEGLPSKITWPMCIHEIEAWEYAIKQRPDIPKQFIADAVGTYFEHVSELFGTDKYHEILQIASDKLGIGPKSQMSASEKDITDRWFKAWDAIKTEFPYPMYGRDFWEKKLKERGFVKPKEFVELDKESAKEDRQREQEESQMSANRILSVCQVTLDADCMNAITRGTCPGGCNTCLINVRFILDDANWLPKGHDPSNLVLTMNEIPGEVVSRLYSPLASRHSMTSWIMGKTER